MQHVWREGKGTGGEEELCLNFDRSQRAARGRHRRSGVCGFEIAISEFQGKQKEQIWLEID